MNFVGDAEEVFGKTEDWVEKEAGVIEHKITGSKVYHSAEAIGKKIDAWFVTETASLESGAAKYYQEAIAKIKGLF